MALAGLAQAESWDGDPASAKAHADAAVRVARQNGSDMALAPALNAWTMVHLEETVLAMDAAEEALRLARRCGDAKGVVDGSIWLVNLQEAQLRVEEAADVGRRAFAEASRLGDLHWCYFIATMTAEYLLRLGRFDEAAHLLREALAVRCVGIPGAATRLSAAKLAIRTGQLDTACSHLDRALEVVEPDFAGFRPQLIATEAELRIARGDPAAARWVGDHGFSDGQPGKLPFDRLYWFVWLARALAVVARTARDTGDREAERLTVDEVTRWAEVVNQECQDVLQPDDELAQLIASAELARCRGDSDEVEHWEQVVVVCRSAALRWDEACALQRLAEAALRLHAPRDVIADTLRRLHELAVAMGPHPLREQAERLGRAARVSLLDPMAIPAQPTGGSSRIDSLTPRKREILGHLVAPTPIAKSLVIRDKTVSVHVSNTLRKTDNSSRALPKPRPVRPNGPVSVSDQSTRRDQAAASGLDRQTGQVSGQRYVRATSWPVIAVMLRGLVMILRPNPRPRGHRTRSPPTGTCPDDRPPTRPKATASGPGSASSAV